MGKVKHPPRWSFSAWSTLQQCPQRYWYEYLAPNRVPAPPSEAMARGTAIHKDLEHYVKTPRARVPGSALNLRDELMALKRKYREPGALVAERKYYLDRDLCVIPDSEINRAWCSVTADVLGVAAGHVLMVDFKSGKKYPDKHKLQLELYSAALLSMFPGCTFEAEAWYTDLGAILGMTLEPARLREARTEWIERGEQLQATQEFPRKPSNLCAWCPNSYRNGGPCSENA